MQARHLQDISKSRMTFREFIKANRDIHRTYRRQERHPLGIQEARTIFTGYIENKRNAQISYRKPRENLQYILKPRQTEDILKIKKVTKIHWRHGHSWLYQRQEEQ